MALEDLLSFGFVLFFTALVFVSGALMLNTLAGVDYFNQTFNQTGKNTNLSVTSLQLAGTFDWGFMIFASVLVITMFVLGFLLPSHPVFTFIGVVALFIWLFVSPYLSNAFDMLFTIDIISDVAYLFPMTRAFFENLPVVGFFTGIIVGILTYGKRSG